VRAKFVNEKFTEDGDPIQDLGIGLKHDFKTLDEMYDWISKNLPLILRIKKIPEDIIKDDHFYVRMYYKNKIQKFMRNFLTVDGIFLYDGMGPLHYKLKDMGYKSE